MSDDIRSQEANLKRRTILSGLGAAGAMGLAGCSDLLGEDEPGPGGTTGEDEDELGERVPTQTMSHFTGYYVMESAAEAISQQLPERLGVDLEISALDTATAVGNLTADNRYASLPLYFISSRPEGTYAWERYTVDEAGAGGTNTSQWTDCVYSVLINEQRKIPDEDQRREVVYEAVSRRSNDLAIINAGIPLDNQWAYWPDQVRVDEDRIGSVSFNTDNPRLWETVELIGDASHIETATLASHLYIRTNFFTHTSQRAPWNNLLHSKLFYYDEEYELMQADLAENVEVSDDGLEYTVELVDDATFHNGDPVTAEDVKFTFEYLTENADLFQDAPRVDLEVEAVDDTTAVFHLEEPYAPLLLRDFHNWGILHRETWVEAGALEDPEGTDPDPEDFVGSGPFQLTSFTGQERLTMDPYTDHHHFDPDPSASISVNVYGDTTSIFEALRAGDLAIAPVSPPQLEEVENELDDLESAPGMDLLTLNIMPQCSMAPTQFFEFREAVAMALNYQEIEALTTLGQMEPDIYAETTATSHPRRPPNDMLYEQGNGDVQGDPEAARAVLEEAGWGWDDDGDLHYPADADLSPRWEEEGTPDPDDYPCLDADGNYVRPDDEIDLPVDLDEYIA